MLDVRFLQLYHRAILPRYATDGSACLDLFTYHPISDGMVSFGWAVEVPPGHAMLIFSRSGHGFKLGVRLANCVGIIDSDYRGEVKALLVRDGNRIVVPQPLFNAGAAVAQALVLPVPRVKAQWADRLSETARGAGGFGSTDMNEERGSNVDNQ